MAAHKLKQFLDENKVQYESIAHEPSYTAQGIAHSAHLSGKELAKTVILKADGRLVMAVLPGNEKVHLDEFKRSVGAQEVVLAEEPDFLDTFPGCELGAMPPFGNLWD
ncbi:MAG: aminoacyl-tRNA deacylase, partial [Planctomycetota bacterium]